MVSLKGCVALRVRVCVTLYKIRSKENGTYIIFAHVKADYSSYGESGWLVEVDSRGIWQMVVMIANIGQDPNLTNLF